MIMQLNAYKDLTHDMCVRKGWSNVPVTTVWLLLTEEIGELASSIRQYHRVYSKQVKKIKGTDIQMEMGDVFSYLFQLAHMLDVDLDEMWAKHQYKMSQRNYNE